MRSPEIRFKTFRDYTRLEDDQSSLTFAEVLRFSEEARENGKRVRGSNPLEVVLRGRILAEFFSIKGMRQYREKPWSSGTSFCLVFGFHDRYFSEISFAVFEGKISTNVAVRDGEAEKDKLYSKDYKVTLSLKKRNDSIRALALRSLAAAHEQIERIAKRDLTKAQQAYATLVESLFTE